MKPKLAWVLLGVGIVGATAAHLSLRADPEAAPLATRLFFVTTVAVEVLALAGALWARAGFEAGDDGRRTWTLVSVFLGLRLLAQARLTTLYFDLVPGFVADDPSSLFFYRVVLRYLYTVADVVCVAALASAARTYRAVGLGFELRPVDYAVAGLLAIMPMASFALRANLSTFTAETDLTIVTYRLIAVSVGSIIAGLSLVLLRYASLMGGGLMARVWRAAALSGLARTLSFVALAALTPQSVELAEYVESLLLWCFACGWLLAAAEQRELWRDE